MHLRIRLCLCVDPAANLLVLYCVPVDVGCSCNHTLMLMLLPFGINAHDFPQHGTFKSTILGNALCHTNHHIFWYICLPSLRLLDLIWVVKCIGQKLGPLSVFSWGNVYFAVNCRANTCMCVHIPYCLQNYAPFTLIWVHSCVWGCMHCGVSTSGNPRPALVSPQGCECGTLFFWPPCTPVTLPNTFGIVWSLTL